MNCCKSVGVKVADDGASAAGDDPEKVARRRPEASVSSPDDSAGDQVECQHGLTRSECNVCAYLGS